MYPSRPAPSPPSPSIRDRTLPPNHPFATFYNPPQYQSFNGSAGCLNNYTARSSSIGTRDRQNGNRTTPSSPSSYKWRSPTSSLAQPLTPPRRTSASGTASVTSSDCSYDSDRYGYVSAYSYGSNLGHFATQPLDRTKSSPSSGFDSDYSPSVTSSPDPAYSRSSPPPRAPYDAAVPSEMNIFDERPRQNLLSDVEYILGKKISFPFINSFMKSKQSKSNKEATSNNEKKPKKSRRLTTERGVGENWEWEDIQQLSEVVVVSNEQEKRTRARGVREGNWL